MMMQGGNHGNHLLQENASPELEHRAKKAGDKFSETLHVIANEPSLAFFRIQEHVRKSLPQLVSKKHEVQDLQQEIRGATFDMEYATKAVAGMERSKIHFHSIQEQLKNSMFIRQQLKYEQSRSGSDEPGTDSPRARSSSLSSHTWVGPAALMR